LSKFADFNLPTPAAVSAPVGRDSAQISRKSLASENYSSCVGYRAALFT